MSKHLILIHGRNVKPEKNVLEPLWIEALQHGIARDWSADKATKFDNTQKTFAYYGDISNECLREDGRVYDEDEDAEDRKKALVKLKEFDKRDFLGDRGKDEYKALFERSSWKTILANWADRLPITWLSNLVIGRFLSDMKAYWNPDTAFGSRVRWRLTEPLGEALRDEQDVLVISHSLGALITYDVL